MCVETIIKHCGESFNICLINDSSFDKLLNRWSIDLDKLPQPMKERTRTLGCLRLLEKYGGVLLPNSMLLMRDFIHYHEKIWVWMEYMWENLYRGTIHQV